MAFLAKHFSFMFLLIVLISCLQIHARESKFFNKFTLTSTKHKVFLDSKISIAPTPDPASAPAPTPEAVPPTIAAAPASEPAEAPAQFYAENGSGYGLYGRESNQFPPTKESVTAATDRNGLLNEELSAENYDTGYQNNNYGNNGYTGSNYNNNNGYVTEKQGMSDTRFMQNHQSSNYYNNNNNNNNGYTNNNNNYNAAYASNYKSNGYTGGSNRGSYTGNKHSTNNGYYENEKQGMSDTRFLENGKYYYDVVNENNYDDDANNGSESERGAAATNEGYYYGNTQTVNEFNTMEEFENQQQEYQESPEEYVP